MYRKLNAKIGTENIQGTIYPPFREFSNVNISTMLPLTDLKFTFRKTYQYVYQIT